MTNILITGGSGFLGSHLVNYLSKNKKNNIIALDNNFRGITKNLKKRKNVKFKRIDIRKKDKIKNIMKNVDVVIHLAFINGTNYFYEKPELVIDVGLKGTLNLIELSNNSNIKKFIFASSSEVYQKPYKIPTDEKEMCKIPNVKNPRYSYGASKLIGEIATLHMLKKGIKKIIFRPHNLYGTKMGFNHIIPEIISKIYKSSKKFKKNTAIIKMQGSGDETRSFCYIDDAIKQIEKILNKGKNNEIYNVGTMEEVKIYNVINIIGRSLNIKLHIKKTKIKEGSTSRRCPNMKKTFKLGYKSKFRLRKGIEIVSNWYKHHLYLQEKK